MAEGGGEAVKKREPLYELDTDKVTQEVEAEAEGVLLKIFVNEGEVDVGTTIAVIGKEGESFTVPEAPEKATTNGGSPVAAEKVALSQRQQQAPRRRPVRSRPARLRTRPASRRLRSRGVWPASAGWTSRGVAGTGPEGRIIAEDVEKSAGSAGAGALCRRLPRARSRSSS